MVRRLEQRIAARRARARRHSALQSFATTYGFESCPPGIEHETAGRLLDGLGAGSTQAELSFAGRWDGRPATVSSVLVQGQAPFAREGRREPEQSMLVVVLETGPSASQWSVVITADGIVPAEADTVSNGLLTQLQQAERAALLNSGDSLGCGKAELASVSRWPLRESPAEPANRLKVLATLVASTGWS